MNVRKIAQSAMKQLGVLAAGENAEAGELADAIDSLQSLLAQWATDRLYVHKALIIEIPLNGSGTYIVSQKTGDCCCTFIKTPCCDQVKVPKITAQISHIAESGWLDDQVVPLVRDVNNTATYVPVWYQVEHDQWLFHVCDNDAKTLRIKAYTLPQNLHCDDDLELRAHYERPLILSLAIEIAAMFGIEPSAVLQRNHFNAITLLKRSNSTPLYVKNDLPVGVHRERCY